MSYTHFTLEERKYLQELLSEGKSMRKIAALLGRSPSSVSREIKRNKAKNKPHRKTDNPYWYSCFRAQNFYMERRRGQHRRVLQPYSEAWVFIVDGLSRFGLRKKSAGVGMCCIQTGSRCISRQSTAILPGENFLKSDKKRISDAEGNGMCPEIPSITAFSRTASFQSGRKRSVKGNA